MSKNVPHVVYHVACMGNWPEVVTEQFKMLKDCGLGEALESIGDSVGITHLGQEGTIHFILDCAKQHGVPVHIVRSDQNTDHYETFAMMEIERLAKEQNTDRPIIYLHTKGVSNPGCQLKVQWRRCMGYHVVTKWKENVGYIADGGKYDAAGWIWIDRGEQHFTGTMWMVRADWIRRLPPFIAYHHAKSLVRYSCELWVGAQGNPTCRAFSHGPVNRFVHYGDFDFAPYLQPRNIAKIVFEKKSEDVSVTWVSAATINYLNDLNRLQSSLSKLIGHELVTKVLSNGQPWKMYMKTDAMRSMLQSVTTSHMFWIDADCEFREDIPISMLTKKPLSAVQHFAYNRPSDGIPTRLLGRLPTKPKDIYWQACLWGGEVESVASVLNEIDWIKDDERGYDEHALNIELQKRFDQVQTLPCRLATPDTFLNMQAGYEKSYHERSGGECLIRHYNREITS